MGIFTSSKDNALRWMPWDLNDDKSTLVQVMAWCRQATSHYLSQCWPSSMSPYGVTRPQWVNYKYQTSILSDLTEGPPMPPTHLALTKGQCQIEQKFSWFTNQKRISNYFLKFQTWSQKVLLVLPYFSLVLLFFISHVSRTIKNLQYTRAWIALHINISDTKILINFLTK